MNKTMSEVYPYQHKKNINENQIERLGNSIN